MTPPTVAPPPAPPSEQTRIRSSATARGTWRTRWFIILLVLIGFIASGLTRHLVAVQRDRAVGNEGTANLSQMDSFALALLLGGLRGPLVMALWTSSEAQKAERNLEDFDTKVEWIRLLQPGFDSVHIFQMWNKAYNISVQMASLANKYATILDAIDYGYSVNRQRPNNINIIAGIAQIYFDKLGNSHEKYYYRARMRSETMAPELFVRISYPAERKDDLRRATLRAGIPGGQIRPGPMENGRHSILLKQSQASILRSFFDGPDIRYVDQPRRTLSRNELAGRRVEMDPLLDADFNILPEHRHRLRYLVTYEPFPYGITPFAMGYNYYREAQRLLREEGQVHAQLSSLVIDSRPALALKMWSEEEWERGRRSEMVAFGLPIPVERLDMELPAAAVQLDARIQNPAALDEALYSYDLATRLAEDALVHYRSHLERFTTNLTVYRSHMDVLQAQARLTTADAAYLRAMKLQGDERKAQISQARRNYLAAREKFQLVMMRYYLTDETAAVILPQGMTRAQIDRLSPEQREDIMEQMADAAQRLGEMMFHYEEVMEYLTYIQRIDTRLQLLPKD